MTEEKKTEIPTTEQLIHSIDVLSRRNDALEREVGRLHMVVKAYEKTYNDMFDDIQTLNKGIEGIKSR